MEGVGATSLLTAAARAIESERPGGLLSDPLARPLAGDEGFELLGRGPTGPIATNGSPLYVVRHRFLDDWVIDLTSSLHIRQVVLVAAGLDTRAFRLDWEGGTRVFEVDQQPVFAHKEPVLAALGATPRCDRRVVSADLREDWSSALVEAGLDESRPTVWVAEGLMFYLPEAAVHQLLDDVYRVSASGSYFAADMMSASPGPPQELRDYFAGLGAPFSFFTDDPAGLLRVHGWDAEAIAISDVARRVGVELESRGRIVVASC